MAGLIVKSKVEPEKESGLKFNEDFKVGYSPERINPGDKQHTLSKIVKVASGSCKDSAEQIAQVYEMVIDAGVHRASSIKVAEAAKIIENTQRDVNIALMNELSMIFSKIGINTYEVLEAAGTKWNFLKFFPGLVGGHCIGVDPYYLTYKARELGYHSKIINSGRALNDSMGPYLARQTVKKLIANGKDIVQSRVLVMGATFKEDVSDIRNSKVASVVDELKSFGVAVEVHDPHASNEEINHEYGFELIPEINGKYDAVIVAVNHSDYLTLKVLNGVLGGGAFGNRLMQNLREDKAYTYGCRSGVSVSENGSWFVAGGNFRNEVTDSAIHEILHELKMITSELVTDE